MIAAENSYILVMPNKNVIPVEDIEYARAYVNRYYERKIEECKGAKEYEEYDLTDEDVREEIFRKVGNDEGEPMLYDTDKVIEAVRESDFFEEEQEEIIEKLLSYNVELDVEKYSLDTVLAEVEPVELFAY
ncbi:MAG: hypothetical protein ACRCTZ_02130 [Sarcina sp.]